MLNIDEFERIHPESGRVFLRNCVIAAFFVARPLHEVSNSIATALDQYVAMIPPDTLKWVVPSATAEEWKPFTAKTIAKCKSYLVSEGTKKRYMTAFHLSDTEGGVPRYSFNLVGKPVVDTTPEELTLIQMAFPLSVLAADQVERFVSSIRRLATIIPTTSGYCSPALVIPRDLHIGEGIYAARPIALRHPGYDVENNEGTCVRIGTKTRGARWITLLGEELTMQLGGIEALQKRLLPPVTVNEIGAGVMIRAGAEPELGDVNMSIPTPNLRAVAEAIKSVTFFDDCAMIGIFGDADDPEPLARWEHRFLD